MPREATPEELELLEPKQKKAPRAATPEELKLLEGSPPDRPRADNEPQLKAASPDKPIGGLTSTPSTLPPVPTTAETNLRAARQGLSLGLADEGEGLKFGALALLATQDPEAAKKVYRAYQQREQSADTAAVKENPALKTLAGFIPYLAGGPATGGVLKSAAKGAAHFGGLAGAQAFGESKKTGLDAAKESILPAAIGGVLGAVGGVGQGISNRAKGLAQKARQQASTEAQAQVASGIAEETGKLGSAKADINRTLEVLLERGKDPALSSEAKIAAAKALRDHGPERLSELVTSKAEGFPGQIQRYDDLVKRLSDVKAAAPGETERLMQEALKTPGFKEYLKGTVPGKLVTESRLAQLLKGGTSPAHKMTNARILEALSMPAKSAKPGVAKLTFAEWLKNKERKNE